MSDDTQDEQRIDTWANMITGLGTAQDKSTFTRWKPAQLLTSENLDAIYGGEPLGARIIDLLPDEMTRAPFVAKSPGDPYDWSATTSELERHGALAVLGDAVRWARLYGGGLLVFEVDDGRDQRLPLDLGSVRVLVRVHFVEADYARPGAGSMVSPETWVIGGPTTESREIHKSRVIRFDGVRVSPGWRSRYGKHGWGPSVFDRVIEKVSQLDSAIGYAANILHEISLPTMRIAGLRKMLDQPDGRTRVQLILNSIKDSIDILHMLAVDAADNYESVTRDVTGIVELLGEFKNAVAWAADAPTELLFNVTNAGLNSGNNSGPIRTWYDRVANARTRILTPAVRRWIEIIAAANREQIPASTVIEWAPLWEPTEAEREQARAARATSDSTYHTLGAVTEDEIRKARFVASTEGGFAVPDDAEARALAPALSLVPPDLGSQGGPLEQPAETPPPALDVDKALAIMVAAQSQSIPRDGAIALISIAFPQLAGVVERLVPPPPPPPAPVDPNAPPADDVEAELLQADYEPPDDLLAASALRARLSISEATIRGMHRRGEIGGWRFGRQWRYSPTEILRASHQRQGGQTGEGGGQAPPVAP